MYLPCFWDFQPVCRVSAFWRHYIIPISHFFPGNFQTRFKCGDSRCLGNESQQNKLSGCLSLVIILVLLCCRDQSRNSTQQCKPADFSNEMSLGHYRRDCVDHAEETGELPVEEPQRQKRLRCMPEHQLQKQFPRCWLSGKNRGTALLWVGLISRNAVEQLNPT